MSEPDVGYNSGVTRVVSVGTIDSSGVFTSGGADHFALADPDGNLLTIGVVGTQYSILLDAAYNATPATAAAAVTGASYVWTDATGCKAFTVSESLKATAADAPIAIAYSTTPDDEAGIQAALLAFYTEFQSTAGNHTGLEMTNIVVLTINDPVKQAFYDGTTTIKTVGALSLSTAASEYLLEVTV